MDNVVCFHLITEPNGYLSNWYHSPFELDGEHYCCVEQYLMHAANAAGFRKRSYHA